MKHFDKGLQQDFRAYLEQCWTQQLLKEAKEILAYYRLQLALPTLTLSADKKRYGGFDPLYNTISINRALIEEQSWDLVLEVLKHELAHAWVWSRGLRETDDHGPEFQAACAKLGVAPWARQARIEENPQLAMSEHRAMSGEEERLLQRVEKLLSLASSSNEHEASLAMQRARELCARHHFEAIASRHEQNYTYIVINHRKKQIQSWQWSILNILSKHFYVNTIARNLFDPRDLKSYRVVDLMGTRENVQMAEYAYWFLFHKLPLLYADIQQQSGSSARNTRSSYYLGVLKGFDEKLSLQRRELVKKTQEWGLLLDPGKQVDLELKSEAELDRFVRSRFPFISGGSGRRLNLTEDAYKLGKQHGRELNIHKALHRDHQGSILLLK